MILDCSFLNTTQSDFSNNNFTLNYGYNKRDKEKKKKKKYDEDLLHLSEYQNLVIIEEEIPKNDIKKLSKTDLLKKIFLYSSNRIKSNMVASDKIICNINFLKKNEIISNNYQELLEKIFSDEFNKEIITIKRMTEMPPPSSQRSFSQYKKSWLEKIAYYLKLFFKKESGTKKKQSTEKLNKKHQEFFLPKVISNQVYYIKPHARTKIGPIIYNPTNFTNNGATLFLKNNLTILYPLKLKGTGGSGVINFYSFEKQPNSGFYKEQLFERLHINLNSTIYDDASIFDDGVVTKTIKVKNTGNLALKVKNISIENFGCEAYGIKLNPCVGFNLEPEQYVKLNITIKPDFNFYFIEKNIVFITQHQQINLNIYLSISKELLASKNRLFRLDNVFGNGFLVFVAAILISLIIL